jgi:long-subunit acyl-CoA synthetase (AMP-forming)
MELGAPSVLVVHVDLLATALEAARAVKLPTDRILVLDAHKSLKPIPLVSLESVIHFGQTAPEFKERKLKRGEGKTKLAVLSFSSGTTGKPKASAATRVVSTTRLMIDAGGCNLAL